MGGGLDYLEALDALRTYMRFNELVISKATKAVNEKNLLLILKIG